MPFAMDKMTTGESAKLDVLTPEGEQSGLVLDVASMYSKAMQDFDVYRSKRVTNFIQRSGSPRKFNTKQQDDYARLTRDLSEEMLVKSVVGWTTGEEDGKIMLGGQMYDCNADNVTMLFEKFPSIKEQVNRFLGDDANFTKA